jgi:prepilin-type processing-associated H-X9-DG protein
VFCLLAPVVNSRRESSRRARCAANLQQIGAALASYASVHQTFPPGAVLHSPSDAANGCGHRDDVTYGNSRDFTAFALILGQMDQHAAYNAINFDLRAGGSNTPYPHAGASNFTGLSARISSYICPSDSETSPLRLSNPYSQTSYFPSGGTWNTMAYYSGPECWSQNPGNGAFDTSAAYPVAVFTDGTGQTIAVGEASRFRNDADPHYNQWSRFGHFISTVDPSSRTSRPQGLAFQVPRVGADLYIFDYVELPPGTSWPDDSDCKAWLKNIVLYKEFGQWGFRSQHPGGAHFLFADGSVHFLRGSIDLATYRALGTRAAQDPISEGGY